MPKHRRFHISAWLLLTVLYVALPCPHLGDYAWNYDEGPLLQAAALANEGYTLYDEIALNKPPLLAWVLQLAFHLAGPTVVVARAAMLALTLIGFLALGALAAQWWGPWAGPAAMALFLALPDLPVRAPVVMNDLPVMSAALVALNAATAYRRSRSRAWLLVGAGAYAALLAIHPLLFFMALPLGLILVYDRRVALLSTAAQWRAGLPFGAIAAILTLAWLLPLPWADFRHWVIDYNTAEVAARYVSRHYASTWHRLWSYLAPWWSLLGLAAGGLLALARRRAHRFWVSLTLLWIYLPGAVLLLQRPLWNHYPFLMMYPLTLAASGGIVALLAPAPRRKPAYRWLGIALVILGLGLFARQRLRHPIQWRAWTTPQQAARDALQAHTTEDAFVISDDQFLAFAAGRHVPPPLADTSLKRIYTGFLGMGEVVHAWLAYDVPVIVSASGRFETLPEMATWRPFVMTSPTCYETICLYPSRSYRPMATQLGDEVRLRGFRLTAEDDDVIAAGETLTVTLFWESLTAPLGEMSVFVHVLDESEEMVAQHDGAPFLGAYPTSAWQAQEVIPDPHPIQLPADLAEGRYQIAVGMYRWPSLARLAAVSAQGERWPNDTIHLDTVSVVHSERDE